MEHYYIFYKNIGDNMYERTCGTEKAAKERVKNLKNIYGYAEYFINRIPKGYKYFY